VNRAIRVLAGVVALTVALVILACVIYALSGFIFAGDAQGVGWRWSVVRDLTVGIAAVLGSIVVMLLLARVAVDMFEKR
jgi:hypothetical protein